MSTTPFDLSGSGSATVSGWYDREHRLHLDCEIDNLSFTTYNEYEDVDVDEAYVYDELESVETDIKEYLEKHNIDITQYEYATFDFEFSLSGEVYEWAGTYWEPPEYDVTFRRAFIDSVDLDELVEFTE